MITGDLQRNTLRNNSDIPLNVTFRGVGSVVEIAAGSTAINVSINVGSNSRVIIDEGGTLGNLNIYCVDDCEISIGRRFGSTYQASVFAHEPAKIAIGAHALFASGVCVYASDMHGVFDLKTKERLNPAQDIVIGDHVWLGQDCAVLKGAVIGSGSVVGMRSVVTGTIPENAVAVGSPARVVRTGVYWRPDFEP